jgi:acyl-CoA thioesterase
MHSRRHDAGQSNASVNDASPDEIAVRCAERMYADDRASRQLGIEISDVLPGRARAAMTVTEHMVNGHDLCHGGYVFLLADTAFAFACNTYDQVTVAASADVVFVRPALRGQRLVADATERIRHGRSGVYDVTVRTAEGSVVAEFRGGSRMLGRSILADADAETATARNPAIAREGARIGSDSATPRSTA